MEQNIFYNIYNYIIHTILYMYTLHVRTWYMCVHMWYTYMYMYGVYLWCTHVVCEHVCMVSMCTYVWYTCVVYMHVCGLSVCDCMMCMCGGVHSIHSCDVEVQGRELLLLLPSPYLLRNYFLLLPEPGVHCSS